MDLRQRHRDLVGLPAEGLAHLGYLLTGEECRFLNKYGAWLEALAKGALEPCSSEQAAFVKVAMGEATPATFAELLWCKWCKHYIPWKAAREARDAEVKIATEAAKRAYEKRLAEMLNPMYGDRGTTSNNSLPIVCNACGSNSPNLCRCSQ